MRYDLGILLGSQIKKDTESKHYYFAHHTELKIQAVLTAYKKGIIDRLLISGGYNFGVRYDNQKILKEVDFSFETFAKARWFDKSEAEVIGKFLIHNGVPVQKIYLEENSAYTEQQAKIIRAILRQTTFENYNKIGIITLAYHMVRAFPIFKKTFKDSRFQVEPVFAEDLLSFQGKQAIERVRKYYASGKKGGMKWPAEKIEELLTNGNSIKNLKEINF